jgi:hypothetical protein
LLTAFRLSLMMLKECLSLRKKGARRLSMKL